MHTTLLVQDTYCEQGTVWQDAYERENMNDELRYWLGLNGLASVGAVRMRYLIEHFGSAKEAWAAKAGALVEAGLSRTLSDRMVEQRPSMQLETLVEQLRLVKADVVTYLDDTYPVALHNLPDAPAMLYVRGQLSSADEKALAVVGTRKATRYGRDAAHFLSSEVAQRGVTIVSGLAQGIDAAAHEGALDGGGRTIAVMGNGIDHFYPRANQDLARRIVEHGAVISEFPIGTAPQRANFPRRNRIISGLSLAVMVVEAPERSGALITAETALEQGRDVFAVPANIFNNAGKGTNRMIQEGARLISSPEDILDELNMTYERVQTSEKTTKVAPASDLEKKILSFVEAEPIHIDDIARGTGLPVYEVSATLTILELKGLIHLSGAMQYSRAP